MDDDPIPQADLRGYLAGQVMRAMLGDGSKLRSMFEDEIPKYADRIAVRACIVADIMLAHLSRR